MACSQYILFLTIALAGWSNCIGEEVSTEAAYNRQPRNLQKRKCLKYGICNNNYGGYGGYDGYQQAHQGGVPINIAISQSQSSANGADGGHANGHFPNNYQHNNGYHGYNHGYGGYHQGYDGYNHGYGGYNQGGYNKFRPGYGNGIGSHNNQFNGNYYNGGVLGHNGGGGYGFQKPFGHYYDEDGSDTNEEDYSDDYGFGRSASASASAVAKSAA